MFTNYSFLFFIAAIVLISQESTGLAVLLSLGLTLTEVYYQWKIRQIKS